MDIHDMIIIARSAPDLLQQLVAGKDPAGVAGQGEQEIELAQGSNAPRAPAASPHGRPDR